MCVTVLLLGARHGLDADHLVAIDALTRQSSYDGRACAPYCGTLFSVGHGLVVLAVGVAIGGAHAMWTPPPWIHLAGAWISIATLGFMGIANLVAVMRTPPGERIESIGLRSRLFAPLERANGPFAVAGIGALFALSFDTLSQAALFGITSTRFGGVMHALALGLLFTLGMTTVDTINGLWIARLTARADARAAQATRTLGLTIAGTSLLVAGIGIAKVSSTEFEAWSDGKALSLAAIVTVVILAGYMLGPCASLRTTPPAAD